MQDARPIVFSDASQSHHYAVIKVVAEKGFTRELLQRVLAAENVQARRYFWPGCHRSPPYTSLGSAPVSLPRTDRLAEELIQLPTGTQLSPQEAARIGELIALCATHREELVGAMESIG